MPNARGERCRRFDAGVLRCAPPRRVGNGRCFCLQQVFDEKSTMSAHVGEKAEKTGDFRCAKCHQSVHVTKDRAILKCPHCGNETYATRVHERGTSRAVERRRRVPPRSTLMT